MRHLTRRARPWCYRSQLALAIALAPVVTGCASSPGRVAPSPTAASAVAAERVPVLLIAIDAFRKAYMDSFPAPSINALAKAGVRGDGMQPVYPTVTFPNHVALVTGRYPEDHQFRYIDRNAGSCFIRAEPIWVT